MFDDARNGGGTPEENAAVGAATVRERVRFLDLTPLPYGRGSDGYAPAPLASAARAWTIRSLSRSPEPCSQNRLLARKRGRHDGVR